MNVIIEDKNDNSPRFDSTSVRIAVPENVATGSPIYTAHATDPDSEANGDVRYELIGSTQEPSYFQVDRNRGTISLIHGLDYETVHRLTVTVIARDSGVPPLSDNMTLVVDVQDINDNPPVFERPHYAATVLESLPVNSQVSATTIHPSTPSLPLSLSHSFFFTPNPRNRTSYTPTHTHTHRVLV